MFFDLDFLFGFATTEKLYLRLNLMFGSYKFEELQVRRLHHFYG